MIRKRLSLLTPFCFSLLRASIMGADTELHAGNTHDGTLTAPRTDFYSVSLKAGDLAETNVMTHGTKLIITVYGPSGAKVRGFRFNGVDGKVQFIGDGPVHTGSKWLLTERLRKGHTQLRSQGSSPLQIELRRRLRSDMKARELGHSELLSKAAKRAQLRTSGKR